MSSIMRRRSGLSDNSSARATAPHSADASSSRRIVRPGGVGQPPRPTERVGLEKPRSNQRITTNRFIQSFRYSYNICHVYIPYFVMNGEAVIADKTGLRQIGDSDEFVWYTQSLLSGQKVNSSNWLRSSSSSNRSGVAKIAACIGIFSNTVTEKTCSNV